MATVRCREQGSKVLEFSVTSRSWVGTVNDCREILTTGNDAFLLGLSPGGLTKRLA